MSHKDFLKKSLLLHLPDGALRQLEDGGDEDRLYDGIAEALVPGYEQMSSMAAIREPDDVYDLELLEKEYGFLPNPDLTEDERRARIKSLKYARRGSGTGEALQDALALAGFDQFVVVEGRQDQNPASVISAEGEYVVNGFEYLVATGYIIGCDVTPGTPDTYDFGCASPYKYGCEELQKVLVTVPWNPTDNWNLVFFVADDIVTDVNGYITSMTAAVIDLKYRQLIREIILRIKPLQTWGYLAVDWAESTPGVDHWGFGFFPFGISQHGL